MKRFGLVILTTFLLASTATAIEHNFHTMLNGGTLSCPNPYKIGTISGSPDTIYTCTGSAVFGADLVNPSGYQVIAINLPNSSSVVTLSPSIENLTIIRLMHYPLTTRTNIKVYVSPTTTFGDPLSGDAIRYDNGVIEATIPKGNYYIKIANTSSTAVSIYQIDYFTSSCNCFVVE